MELSPVNTSKVPVQKVSHEDQKHTQNPLYNKKNKRITAIADTVTSSLDVVKITSNPLYNKANKKKVAVVKRSPRSKSPNSEHAKFPKYPELKTCKNPLHRERTHDVSEENAFYVKFNKLSISSSQPLHKKKSKIKFLSPRDTPITELSLPKFRELSKSDPCIGNRLKEHEREKDHFAQMIKFLNRDTNDKSSSFLLDHFPEIVRDKMREINIEQIAGAGEDLWRIADKYKFDMVLENFNCVQDIHPEAYENKAIGCDVQTERFVNILQAFLQYAGSDIKIPNHDWKQHEHIGLWIASEPQFLKNPQLSRLLFSCRQARYTDTVLRQLILNMYGQLAQVVSPIMAKPDSRNIHFCREMKKDLHVETIQIPLDIVSRYTEGTFSRKVAFEMKFHYDADCYLTRICTGIVRKQKLFIGDTILDPTVL